MSKKSSREDGRGGFTIFPADWFAEETLKFVSMGAHGLWINMLLLMHRSPIRGELRRGNGSKIDGEGIAIILGRLTSEIHPLLQELITEKVCLTLEDGTLCNRRMLDEKTSKEKHQDAGLLGALTRWGDDSNPDRDGIDNSKSDGADRKGKERSGREGKGKGLSVVSFDAKQRRFGGITSDDLGAWAKAYPATGIEIELRRMVEWLLANPTKAVKRNWRRFITNWLSRTQDGGGSRGVPSEKGTNNGKPPGRRYRASKKVEA